jgi:hypothetical protein
MGDTLMARKGEAATVCGRGHPLTADNLYLNPTTRRRFCLTCRKMWQGVMVKLNAAQDISPEVIAAAQRSAMRLPAINWEAPIQREWPLEVARELPFL